MAQNLSETLSNDSLLQEALEKAAQALDIEAQHLQIWLSQYPLNLYSKIQVLRLAKKYQLDPLCDEIDVMTTIDGYQVFITIDGWVKLINAHEQFAGMSFREPNHSESEVPAWMECTIYRHDRILPIVVKEYLVEVQTEHTSWQEMPRRMLRHRVIQQCARLAFGISQADGIRDARLAHQEWVGELATTKSAEFKIKGTEGLKKSLVSQRA